MAADRYPRSNAGNFISAGLIGAILFRAAGGKKAPEEVIQAAPPVVAAVKECQTATLTGDTNRNIYDVLRGDASRFSGVRGLIGDCDEVMRSLQVDEPLTLLAPENGALAQVSPQTVAMLRADKGKLCELLKDHVLIGRYKYEDLCRLSDGKKMLLLSGNTVVLGNKNGRVTLNGIEVAPVDIAASNGWIHPVKGLLRTNLP